MPSRDSGRSPTGNRPPLQTRSAGRGAGHRERSPRWLIPSACRARSRGTDKTLSFETGKLAPQCQGAVVATIGGTTVLATANAAKDVREGIDFFPLTVDVEERAYAAGKIPGSFFRREGRPTEDAILTCRLTDRPLRPSFPEGFRNETQVVITVIGADQENPHDVLVDQRRLGGADDLAASRSTARSAPSASPTARTASGSRTRPTTRATPARSSSSSPGVSSTTATSPS